uniref:Cytochrome P450 n=1 Tax=Arnebia euchroma TaxID=373122 RepID=A0A3Q9R4M7_ARNEU|nr:cytochrome P450 [Arnebia euchroma]
MLSQLMMVKIMNIFSIITEGKVVYTAFIAISIVTLSTIFFISKSRSQIEASLPPGPRGVPILGYLPFLSPNLHHDFAKIATKYGPIFKLWLGTKLCMVVSSPDLAKQLVRDHDKIMGNRDVTIAAKEITYGGIDISFSPYGPYWRNMRKVFARDMLSSRNLEATYTLRKTEVRKTIQYIHSKIGEKINIGDLGYRTALNVVMSMLWGGSVNEEMCNRVAVEVGDVSSDIMYLLGKPNISDLFPILERFDIQGVKSQMKKIFGRMDNILDKVLEERRKMGTENIEGREEKKDVLQILLELKEHNEAGVSIDNSQVKAIMVDIIIGGTDTTATTLEWVMAELIANPHVLKKLKHELTTMVGMNNIVEEVHLSKLKYLEACVKEALRLHPTLPFLLPKYPTQTTLVGGFTIPKETKVFLNIWALQRDPEVWKNPLEFNPDRFLDENCKFDFEGNNFRYLPFGSGRRICAGLPLAEKMVMYMLASLLHSFDWKLPEGEVVDLTEKFGLSMKKSIPLIAIPFQRLNHIELYE